jgi:hypothetical protein
MNFIVIMKIRILTAIFLVRSGSVEDSNFVQGTKTFKTL